jgi:hypothetical protein
VAEGDLQNSDPGWWKAGGDTFYPLWRIQLGRGVFISLLGNRKEITFLSISRCPAELNRWLVEDTAGSMWRLSSKELHAGLSGLYPAFIIWGGLCEDMVHIWTNHQNYYPELNHNWSRMAFLPCLSSTLRYWFYANTYILFQNNFCSYLCFSLLSMKLNTKSIKII